MYHTDFDSIANSSLIITTHDLISYFGSKEENHKKLEPFIGFIDEIDRLSNTHPLSFDGGNKVAEAFGRGFFGFCADPLSGEQEGPLGLGLPEGVVTTQINMDGEFEPKIDYCEITDSGDDVYRRIINESGK